MVQTAAVSLQFLHNLEHPLRVTLRAAHRRPPAATRRENSPISARNFVRVQGVAAARDRLIERGERVADAALADVRQNPERFIVGLDAFLFADPAHPSDQFVIIDGSETELLAAARNRDRNLVRFGRAQDENDPLRRFFQRFQKRVEGFRS